VHDGVCVCAHVWAQVGDHLFIYCSFVGHGRCWLASIYCPSLVAFEKVKVSCLLDTLWSTCCGLTHNADREESQRFSPSGCEGTAIYFKVRMVSGPEGNLQVVVFPCICCYCPARWNCFLGLERAVSGFLVNCSNACYRYYTLLLLRVGGGGIECL